MAFLGAGTWLGASGHGSLIALFVASSPLYLFGVRSAFFGIPIMWAAIWGLTSAVRMTRIRVFLIAILVCHYAGLMYLPVFLGADEPQYLRRTFHEMPMMALASVAMYCACHLSLWRLITTNTERHLKFRFGLNHALAVLTLIAVLLALIQWSRH